MFSVGQIISSYRKKKGYSQPVLAAKLAEEGISISYKTISSWEKNSSEPSVTTFFALCKVLNIADVYAEYYGINPGNTISFLNKEGQEKVQEYIQLLLLSNDYKKTIPECLPFPTRNIRLYSVMASAGTGNFLEGTDFELVEVGDEVPESADFGIKLSGDSMEPKYIHQQTVWVHQQDSLLHGEIGIFFYNGNAFCKKLQDNTDGIYLISLNQKYEPIRITEHDTFKIFGKVVG